MTWLLLQSLRRHSGNCGILRVYNLSRKGGNSRRWSRSRGIYRSCVSSWPILWVFLARVGRSKGRKGKEAEKGRRREAKEASYVCGGLVRRPACELCVSKMSGQRARPYEHNSARYTRTDLSRLAPRAVSLMDPHTAAWTMYPMRGEVRGPSVPILCPIRLIPSKVPRLESGHLGGENLSPNFT